MLWSRKQWLGLVFSVLILASAPQGRAQTSEDLFDSSTLHAVYLDLAPSDWASLKQNYLANTYYEATLRWVYQGRTVEVRRVGIRSRGSGSRSPVKPGIGVDFTRYDSAQRFLGLKALVLRNNTQDASMMREAVAMAVFRKLGLQASREAFARLYVNGQYSGLYTLVESIDSGFLDRRFAESDGYLYSVDRASADDPPFLFEDKGSDPALYMPLPLKLENHTSDPAPGPVVEMIQAINRIPEADFAARMAAYVDLKQVLLQAGVDAYLAEQDGLLGDYGTNNVYFYRYVGDNQFAFITWDKSNAFWDVSRSIWMHTDTNVLLRRALAIPELREVFRSAVLRTAAMSGWIAGEIDRFYKQIREAALQDPYKQCYDSASIMADCSNARFEADVAYLRRFAAERDAVVFGQLASNVAKFSFSNGAVSLRTEGDAALPLAGHAAVDMDGNNPLPSGVAILGLRQNGVLVTETAAPFSSPVSRGQVWTQLDSATTTGLSLVNLGTRPATVSFYFADATGRRSGLGTTTLEAGAQISRLLTESPFNGTRDFSGSFAFAASSPISAAAIRGEWNNRGEFIMASIPLVDADTASPPVILPDFAQGGGWQTEIVLQNPTTQAESGALEFSSGGAASFNGAPLNVVANGVTASVFRYVVPAGGVFRLRLSDAPPLLFQGSIRVRPDNVPPFSILSLTRTTGGSITSGTVLPGVQPGAAFDVYIERAGTLDTAVVITNPADQSASVVLAYRTLAGRQLGPQSSMTVPAKGQALLFLSQIPEFSDLPSSLQGMLSVVSSSTSGVSVAALRYRRNERGELLVTALPASSRTDVVRTPAGFPLMISGGGYSTQVVLAGTPQGLYVSGSLRTVSQSGMGAGPTLGATSTLGSVSPTGVASANPVVAGAEMAEVLSPELLGMVVARGSMRLENPTAAKSFFGYDNDLLAAPGVPKMVPDPGQLPTLGEKVEATKSDPDKNTYLVFRHSLTGADRYYDYGTHFLFQGHERGAEGYITRINLDADAEHHITLMASKDSSGKVLPIFDGSAWYPFSRRLLFTSEVPSTGGVWQATPDYPAVVEDISGSLGRASYEGIQTDNRGNIFLVEHLAGPRGTVYAHAKQPYSFIYRFVPNDLTDLRKGGRLQALQVVSRSTGLPISLGASADADIRSQDVRDLHTYGLTFQARWVTIHDTAVAGSTPFDARAAAASAKATPFKAPENGQFRPGIDFAEFFFTATGDVDVATEAGSDYGGFGAIFRVKVSGSDVAELSLFYKGDSAHTGPDNLTFWGADALLVAEDAGEGVHTQRNAFDSIYLLDLGSAYSSGSQPVRVVAGGRDASATIDSRLVGMDAFQNAGDNEITGIHISDGDSSIAGMIGTYAHLPFSDGWRVFYTEQHGDNTIFEILPAP